VTNRDRNDFDEGFGVGFKIDNECPSALLLFSSFVQLFKWLYF